MELYGAPISMVINPFLEFRGEKTQLPFCFGHFQGPRLPPFIMIEGAHLVAMFRSAQYDDCLTYSPSCTRAEIRV